MFVGVIRLGVVRSTVFVLILALFTQFLAFFISTIWLCYCSIFVCFVLHSVLVAMISSLHHFLVHNYFDLIHLSRESFQKQHLNLHEVGVRSACTLSFPNSTRAITLGMLLLYLSWQLMLAHFTIFSPSPNYWLMSCEKINLGNPKCHLPLII